LIFLYNLEYKEFKKRNNMEIATILSIFISSLLVGITGYSIYTSFGPTSKSLRDPFEEHED
jgi:PsbN protein